MKVLQSRARRTGGFLCGPVHNGPRTVRHLSFYAANSNVVALAKANDSARAADYENGARVQGMRSTGPRPKAHQFRWCTKRRCNTTDAALYEYGPYSPALGRWLSRDPAGEAGFRVQGAYGGRLPRLLVTSTHYVRKQSIDSVDVLGLYEYEWGRSFSDAERQAIHTSIQRVKQRAGTLIGQIDANIGSLSKLCPCPAYSQLIGNPKRLRKILRRMIRDINDPCKNLEIYSGDIKPGAARYWRSPVPWYDDELTLDNGWCGQSTSEQDSTMFHELSHGQGTGTRIQVLTIMHTRLKC